MEVFDTIIGQNVKLQGNLTNQGAIQINGIVEGQIESDASVMVGNGALVKGPIKAKVIEISGEVHGGITAADRVELMPKAKLVGDVAAKNFVIRMGATFVGKSTLLAEPETAKPIVESGK